LKGFFDNSQAAFFSKLMQERIEEADVLEFVLPAKEYVAYI
jgi:hypothetical protein